MVVDYSSLFGGLEVLWRCELHHRHQAQSIGRQMSLLWLCCEDRGIAAASTVSRCDDPRSQARPELASLASTWYCVTAGS